MSVTYLIFPVRTCAIIVFRSYLILYSFLGKKKLADGKGLSGKGCLIMAKIDAIQNFFGKAIRKNKGNPQNMAKELWVILDFYSSTVEQPNMINVQKEEIVGVCNKKIFQLVKEHIILQSGCSPKQFLIYCTRYLFG